MELNVVDKVLEPGFGKGAFLLPLIERFLALRNGDLEAVLKENVWGIELDPQLYCETLQEISRRWGELPKQHNLVCGDFLLENYGVATADGRSNSATLGIFDEGKFDLIVGNPPFGGTVDVANQDQLERRYGWRGGLKIKKETYSFFIVKSMDLIKSGGKILFICSDTFLTIPTMKGLRNALMREGSCEVVKLVEFSEETNYPMVVLKYIKGKVVDHVVVDHRSVSRREIDQTENLSWRAGGEFSRYFSGPTLSNFVVASSGMTTGKNEYFVRDISGGTVIETYQFEYVDEPITLGRELQRARLGKMSDSQKEKIRQQEVEGRTRRNVKVSELLNPVRVELPNPDYRYYNKAQPGILYAPPRYAIYWKDDGDAVLTYKKNGNWYLHGVGGAPYFQREGMTWRLISSKLDMRYLPEGYILDSGAPCAFLRVGVERDELWFILGWTLTETATSILKTVLNHTMNIQSKDIEKLPYPWWVSPDKKRLAVSLVESLVNRAVGGETFDRNSPEIVKMCALYDFECL